MSLWYWLHGGQPPPDTHPHGLPRRPEPVDHRIDAQEAAVRRLEAQARVWQAQRDDSQAR